MERFSDFHKLTWERKLLQDDLFDEAIAFPISNFHGPAAPESATEKLKRLESSGALDGVRLKAPPTEEERRAAAERESRRLREGPVLPEVPEAEKK
jgi:hypothetical protein